MSESALEFVEVWVEEKIEEMDAAPADIDAQAKTLAAECIKAAQEDGVTEADIKDAFDDLAAFIAGEIEEAFENQPDEGMNLVDEDDVRVINEKEDEEDDGKA